MIIKTYNLQKSLEKEKALEANSNQKLKMWLLKLMDTKENQKLSEGQREERQEEGGA